MAKFLFMGLIAAGLAAASVSTPSQAGTMVMPRLRPVHFNAPHFVPVPAPRPMFVQPGNGGGFAPLDPNAAANVVGAGLDVFGGVLNILTGGN